MVGAVQKIIGGTQFVPEVGEVVGGWNCPMFVGTCGYSYTEWSDSGFYPAGTKSAQMLALYMRFFPIVELNYTWYQMPKSEAVARMVARVPPPFRFSAKLTRTMTHERKGDCQEQILQYRKGIEPLRNHLYAVLVQLSPDFDRSLDNRYYLAKLLDGLEGLPVAVEFRHVSWAVDTVFAELERRRVTLVAVDVPLLPDLFPSLDVVTNPDFFYVRFHGRNRKGWASSNMQKKFDYDYTTEELQKCCQGHIKAMARRSDRGLLFFNNHVRAQAPRNGRKLQQLLKGGL